MKISDACGASPTETVESSDSDTSIVRLRSSDHEKVFSFFPKESIFFVTPSASFGTEISGEG